MENEQSKTSPNRKFVGIGLLTFLVMAVPLTLTLGQQNQDIRQRASEVRPTVRVSPSASPSQVQNASTVLSFAPSTSASNQAKYKVGDTIALDVMINPGQNLPAFMKLEMIYDPTVLQSSSAASFVPNKSVIPNLIEGPIATQNSVLATLSVGANPENAISSTKKIGTLYLKAIAPTSATGVKIVFGSKTKVLSIASRDRADENVLLSSSPAYVLIASSATLTQAPTPTLKVLTTVTPTASSSTILSFNVLLNGIGNAGDKSNRNGKGNQNPRSLQRTLQVELYDSENERVAKLSPVLTFNKSTGSYIGQSEINDIPSGVYRMRIKTDRHLSKNDGTTITITKGQTTLVSQISLSNGDVNDDNQVDIRDFNQINGCFSGIAPAKDCDDTRKLASDLNDDGEVNEFDYNLYLREISVQEGD